MKRHSNNIGSEPKVGQLEATIAQWLVGMRKIWINLMHCWRTELCSLILQRHSLTVVGKGFAKELRDYEVNHSRYPAPSPLETTRPTMIIFGSTIRMHLQCLFQLKRI